MAGYYIYSIDHGVFHQLTTAPTLDQGHILADSMLESFAESDDERTDFWPDDREALTRLIMDRLVRSDWYSDLSIEDAQTWDDLIFSWQQVTGEELGIDFQCYDYESIYWDCAEIAASKGATMMAEPTFGNNGFRFTPKGPRMESYDPIYSFFLPDQCRELLRQLRSVEPHFASLPDKDEGSPREQFFEGLLPPVVDVVERNRVLWVQTDT